MEEWVWKLDKQGIEWTGFYEPDLDNDLTAIAILGNDPEFKRLRLL